MELKKTITNWDQIENESGQPENRRNSVQFNIFDNADTQIGSATVYQGHLNVNLYEIYGYDTIDDGIAKLKAIFGISE